MSRWLLAVLLGLVVSLGLPSASRADATEPTVILEPCWTGPFGNSGPWTVGYGVAGFPPNSEFVAGPLHYDATRDDGTTYSGGFPRGLTHVDADGNYMGGIGLGGDYRVTSTWTWTVESPYVGGTVTKSVTVIETSGGGCREAPTSAEQCKDGGWRDFDFKNQGQCVSFVRHASRDVQVLGISGLQE